MLSVWALKITAIQRLCWFIFPGSDVWRFSLNGNCWGTKFQWQPVFLGHTSSADKQLLHWIHALDGGSLCGHSYAVNLVQHKSILPLKSSAVSSLLVPSGPLRLASDSLNAKPHLSLLPSHPHADPLTARLLSKRNAREERPGALLLPMAMQIRMDDVAT